MIDLEHLSRDEKTPKVEKSSGKAHQLLIFLEIQSFNSAF